MLFDTKTGRRTVAGLLARCAGNILLCCGYLIVFCGFSSLARADWTGVAFEIADTRSDWEFSEDTRESKISSIELQIEERTATGFTVGAGIGFMTMRVDGNDRVETKKFDGEFLHVYLRQDIDLSESFSLDAMFDYGFYSGDENVSTERDDIDWNQLGLEIGASFRSGNIRVTPFASYTDIDGDISGEDPTESFSLDEEFGYGLRFDFFTESTAFVRVKLKGGSHSGGYLTFARRY